MENNMYDDGFTYFEAGSQEVGNLDYLYRRATSMGMYDIEEFFNYAEDFDDFDEVRNDIALDSWITATGQVYKIEDMSDDHLGNTIRYIERNKIPTKKLELMKTELGTRCPFEAL